MIKQEQGLIPGKKKRGRPKKIKNPDDLPSQEIDKMDANSGEVIKKRRGRPKKIHQQQKQAEREAKEREHQQHQQQQQQLHQMGHMDGYGGVPNCFSPAMMSPPKPFSHMAPYPQQMEPQGYYTSMNDSPYDKQSLQHYSQSPKSMSMPPYGHSDLSSDMNPGGGGPMPSENEPSPGMDQHPDFDGSSSGMPPQQQQGSYNPSEHSPGDTPSHSAYSSYMSYHEQQQQQQQQEQQHPHQGAPTPMSQTTDEHSHHSHPTPPHNHQHTPTHSMSPHPHDQYGLKRSAGQDVASKSLSDLESLVDQIPSIAESGNNQRLQQQHSHPGMSDDSLADKLDASNSHQSYMSPYGNPGSNPNPQSYSPPPLSSSYGDSYNSPVYSMSSRQQSEPHSKAYTVENLASSNYTPSHHNAYPNIIPGPHYPVPMSPAAGSTNGYLFGGLESSLMQRTYGGMPAHHHPSLMNHPMTNAYSYQSSYSSSFDAYSSPSPGLHQPNYQGYNTAGSPSSSSYLQQQSGASRPPIDLAYDGA